MTVPRSLKLEKEPRDHERVFIEHYAWLLDWAHQLTQGTPQEAQDLVHDLYVRFVQMKSGPIFEGDEHARAYLYRALKNLFISRKLRHGRDAISGLLVVDFDSVEYAITAVDRSQLFHVRSELAGICEYACKRRKTHRAATAFILRFFFGYAATEVMALIRANRGSMDVFIQTARKEAKSHLARPGVLRFIDRSDKKSYTFPRYLPEDTDALFAELQRRIFSEKEGDCLPYEELEARYSQTQSGGFTAAELAHLVSCRQCLSNATKILGIPDLTLLFSSDPEKPGDSNPPSTGAAADDLKKLRRKLRETYEHRPKKLQIIVDGEVRGVQSVTGSTNNVQIKLQPLSEPRFLEVLSEQGHGLLYLDLEEGSLDQPATPKAEVELSDGRYLSVSLTMVGGGPVIDLYYWDPVFDQNIDDPPTAAAPETLMGAGRGTTVYVPPPSVWGSGPRWLTWILNRLKRLHLLLVSGAVALLFLGAVVSGFHRRPENKDAKPTAAALLKQSSQEKNQAIPLGGALRQSFSLTSSSTASERVGSEKVEMLRSAASPRGALRLLSKDGSLLAGRWTDIHGAISTSTTGSHPGRARHREDDSTLRDNIWIHVPDAEDFRDMAGHNSLTLRATASTYEISFERSADVEQRTIVEAHLVLTSATLRPVAERLRIQEGRTSREYSFIETSLAVLRPEEVREQDFEPEPQIHARPENESVTARPNTDLKLAVLEALWFGGDDIQRSIDLEVLPDGKARVSGVLSTEEKEQDLLQRLRSLRGSEQLQLDVHSATQRMEHGPPSTSTRIEQLQPVSITDERLPSDGILRAQGVDQGLSGEALEARIQAKARELLDFGSQVHRETWMVEQIAARDFQRKEILAMSPAGKERWLALLSRHLERCDVALLGIGKIQDAKPVVAMLDPEENSTLPIRNIDQLSRAAEGLRNGGSRLDELLVAGFAVSPVTSPSTYNPSKLPQLMDELEREERRFTVTVERLQSMTSQQHPK